MGDPQHSIKLRLVSAQYGILPQHFTSSDGFSRNRCRIPRALRIILYESLTMIHVECCTVTSAHT